MYKMKGHMKGKLSEYCTDLIKLQLHINKQGINNPATWEQRS